MRAAPIALAAILLAGAAKAGPLTYDAALTLAASGAPDIQAKALDVKAARSAAVAAGRLPDPKLELGVEGFPVTGPLAFRPAADDFTDMKVGLTQDLPSGAKRRAARARALADIDAAEAVARVAVRQVRLDTALAWIDLYFANRRLAALDEVDRALAPMRETAPAQLASGVIRPAQALAPEQFTAAVDDRRSDLVAAVGKARAELARWTGEAEPVASGPPPDYVVDPVALRASIADVPALRAYDPMSHQADADLQAAKAERRPDTSWELAWQHRDPRFGDMVMLQATIGLPIFASTRQDPIIAARAERASSVLIEREAARRQLVDSLESALADHAMHHERLARAEQTLVPLADRRAHLEAASYAAGNAGLADVLQAFLDLAQARIDLIDRQADVVRDAARIVLTYGSDPQ
jgi:outer membrane protein TolC